MRSKCPFFPLIFGSLFLTSFASAAAAQLNELKEKAIDDNFQKLHEKFDLVIDRVNKLEENSPLGPHFARDFNEMKVTMKHLLATNEKVSKIEKLLLEIIEKMNDEKMSKRDAKNDVINEMSSRCTSFCESKVNTWANESHHQFNEDLENLDFSLNNNSPFKNSSANACDPSPCLNGGHCQPLSYECAACPYLTSGKRCEKLHCNKANHCVQYQNTLYIVIEESGSWEHANNQCISLGLRLAMPKERDTSEFLITHLKTIYLSTTTHFRFWIGLRNDGSSEWRWIDGTALGSYTGGKVNFKYVSGERWGLMWLNGEAVTWWPRSDAEVASNYGYSHYALCEKSVSQFVLK